MGCCIYRVIREVLLIKLSLDQKPEVKGEAMSIREKVEEGAERLGARPHLRKMEEKKGGLLAVGKRMVTDKIRKTAKVEYLSCKHPRCSFVKFQNSEDSRYPKLTEIVKKKSSQH